MLNFVLTKVFLSKHRKAAKDPERDAVWEKVQRQYAAFLSDWRTDLGGKKNDHIFRKLMYRAFLRAKAGCDRWHDYEMAVAPFEEGKPIYYEFTACPAAEFAIRHGLTDIMPALCNVDFASMELIHARLVCTTTCANGCKCDYHLRRPGSVSEGASGIPRRGRIPEKPMREDAQMHEWSMEKRHEKSICKIPICKAV